MRTNHQPPLRIEESYGFALDRVVTWAAAQAYKPLLAALRSKDVEREDSVGSKRTRDLMKHATKLFKGSVDSVKAQTAGLAKTFAERTSNFQRDQFRSHVNSVLGIDVGKVKEADVSGNVERFVADNVALISKIPRELHDDVEELVLDAARTGKRNEDLAKDIHDRFGVSTRHARLVARDQIGRFYGRVNHHRMQHLGVRRAIWRTMTDNRVRDSHVDMEGVVFDLDDPPEVDGENVLPSEAICCRCYSEPILEDLL